MVDHVRKRVGIASGRVTFERVAHILQCLRNVSVTEKWESSQNERRQHHQARKLARSRCLLNGSNSAVGPSRSRWTRHLWRYIDRLPHGTKPIQVRRQFHRLPMRNAVSEPHAESQETPQACEIVVVIWLSEHEALQRAVLVVQ